jgi:hypothetical protein
LPDAFAGVGRKLIAMEQAREDVRLMEEYKAKLEREELERKSEQGDHVLPMTPPRALTASVLQMRSRSG